MIPNYGFGQKFSLAAWTAKTGAVPGFGAKGTGAVDSKQYAANPGFGDDLAAFMAPAFLPLAPDSDGFRLPDDGGCIFSVIGPWKGLAGGQPLRVQCINQTSSIVYPNNPAKDLFGMRSSEADGTEDLTPVFGQGAPANEDVLSFSLPPLPRGTYTVRVLYGPGYVQYFSITDAFTVIFRHQARQAWQIRTRLPKHWFGAGPRTSAAEPLVLNDTDAQAQFPGSFSWVWSRAIAESLQEFSGTAVVRLRADFQEDATTALVETTLGFPQQGVFGVGKKRFSYTGRTADTLTGCTVIKAADGRTIPLGSLVAYIQSSWAPTE